MSDIEFKAGMKNTTDGNVSKGQILVSVIVPTLNSAKIIETCLASVKKQTYPNIQIIVVDNNSADETKSTARRYTDMVFNKGPERDEQRSYGVIMAKGEYLVFIDSDMELPPNLVETALNTCEREGFDAVILPEISVGKGFWADCRRLEKQCYFNDNLMEAANRFMKADVYRAVGGYKLGMIMREDFDLHDRIREAGYRIGRIDCVINHHEIVPFGKMLRKYFYYGQNVMTYLKRYPKTEIKRDFIIRPAYLRNWRLFLAHPILGSGLAFMKAAQFIASTLGLMSTFFKNNRKEKIEEG